MEPHIVVNDWRVFLTVKCGFAGGLVERRAHRRYTINADLNEREARHGIRKY